MARSFPNSIILPVGTPTAGKVWTATDTSGNASWTAPSAADMILASAQTNTGKKTFNFGTLLDKGSAVYNVKAYGALGTGAGNDSSFIQAAISDISANGAGGTLYFPAGDYIIGSTVTIPSNVQVQGAGRRATRLFKSGDVYTMFDISGTAGANKEKITFKDLSIEGNSKTGIAVNASYTQLCYYINLTVDGCNDTLFEMKSAQDSYFIDFSANTNHTTKPLINIYGSFSGIGWNSNMIWFSQVRLEDFWGPAISITQGAGYTGTNNGFFFNQCKVESIAIQDDLVIFDAATEEVHMNQIFLSAGGFSNATTTPRNGIKSAVSKIASFENIFMNSSAGITRSVLDVASSTGEVVINNISLNTTPTVAVVNFTGAVAAKYHIGLVAGATPLFAGTSIPLSSTLIDSEILGSLMLKKVDAELDIINTFGGGTTPAFVKNSYNGAQFGYKNNSNYLYVGDIALAGLTYVGTAHQQAVAAVADLTNIIDDGAGNATFKAGMKLTGLAGTGTRSVVADLNGTLSTQAALSLTTTGTTGAATLVGSTLNIPQYAGSGSAGITRSISTVTTTITGGATALTDYVYLLSTGAVYTQPSAVSNTNRYTLKNITGSNITVSSTLSQTFDGGTLVLSPSASVDLISDNANWQVA